MTDIDNPEKLSAWVREQFQRANQHLAQKGILFESVLTEESRYLAPYAAVWRIRAQDKQSYWVISGDLPVDAMAIDAAADAREALKRFSFAWQLKAEHIMRADAVDETQEKFAKVLREKADMLYSLSTDKKIWDEAP